MSSRNESQNKEKKHRLEKMVLEQAEQLATQGENMGSGKDELKRVKVMISRIDVHRTSRRTRKKNT